VCLIFNFSRNYPQRLPPTRWLRARWKSMKGWALIVRRAAVAGARAHAATFRQPRRFGRAMLWPATCKRAVQSAASNILDPPRATRRSVERLSRILRLNGKES